VGSESTLRWEGLQAGGDFERLGVAECTTWFLPSDVRNHSAQMRYSADARGRESEVGFHGTGGTPQFGPFRTRPGTPASRRFSSQNPLFEAELRVGEMPAGAREQPRLAGNSPRRVVCACDDQERSVFQCVQSITREYPACRHCTLGYFDFEQRGSALMGKGSGYGLVSAPPLQQTASMKVYVVTGCPNASEAADCS
jgi:hypothetical protein